MLCQVNGSAQEICGDLRVANTFWSRFIGLMGQKSLNDRMGLWIQKCNSIHTCFMKFKIDAVFLDAQLRIVSIKNNIAPFRLVPPQRGASSVLELRSGLAQQLNLRIGMECRVQ